MSEPELRKQTAEGQQIADVTPPPAQEAPPQEAAQIGPVGRLTGVLLSPGETFEDINRKPTWLVPVIIGAATVLAFTLFFNWWVNPDMDQVIRDQIRKQVERQGGQMPPEDQLASAIAIQKKIAQFAPVIAAVFTFIYYLASAGVFALGMMVMQAKTTFKKIFSVVSWTNAAIGLVYTIVFMASLMVRDEEGLRQLDPTNPTATLPTNLGVLMPADTSPFIKSLAGSLDIFSIWTIVVLAIGLAAISGSRKITAGKTGALVTGLWIVVVLIKAGFAAMFG